MARELVLHLKAALGPSSRLGRETTPKTWVIPDYGSGAGFEDR